GHGRVHIPALLCPGHHRLLEVGLAESGLEFRRFVNIPVGDDGLGVAAPGVLGAEAEPGNHRQIDGITRTYFPLRDPFLPQTADLAIAGNLDRVTGTAVDPGVPDFLLHDREPVTDRLHRSGHFAQPAGDDLRRGVAPAQAIEYRVDLRLGVRARVVAANVHGNGGFGFRHHHVAAVVPRVLHHDDLVALRVAPAE